MTANASVLNPNYKPLLIIIGMSTFTGCILSFNIVNNKDSVLTADMMGINDFNGILLYPYGLHGSQYK